MAGKLKNDFRLGKGVSPIRHGRSYGLNEPFRAHDVSPALERSGRRKEKMGEVGNVALAVINDHQKLEL